MPARYFPRCIDWKSGDSYRVNGEHRKTIEGRDTTGSPDPVSASWKQRSDTGKPSRWRSDGFWRLEIDERSLATHAHPSRLLPASTTRPPDRRRSPILRIHDGG